MSNDQFTKLFGYMQSQFEEVNAKLEQTASKESMDNFIQVLKDLKQLAYDDPQKILNAPYTTPVKRVDDVQAARNPILKYPFK